MRPLHSRGGHGHIPRLGQALRHAALYALVHTGLAFEGQLDGEQTVGQVAQRMRYWRSSSAKETTSARRYMLLEQDGAGVNNKRICWEMAGVIALHTDRTLVLPPNQVWWAIDVHGTTTKTEDFINLEQLRRGLRVLTFNEFARKEKETLGLPELTLHQDLNGNELDQWNQFALQHFNRPGITDSKWCDLGNYRSEEVVLYVNHYPEGRLLDCEQWWDLGQPKFTEDKQPWSVPTRAYSLLRNNFVWHEDVFRLAAPIVKQLGLFQYLSVHARFNDFKEFNPDGVQSAQGILDKWEEPISEAGVSFMQQGRALRGDQHMSMLQMRSRSKARAHMLADRIMHWVTPNTVVYVSTDETDESFIRTFKERGVKAYWSYDFFDEASSPIAELVGQDPVRANKLRGCVEQVVCAFGRIFLGTTRSTFTGYITRMRIYADAPQRGLSQETRLFHTQRPTPEVAAAVEGEIRDWEARRGQAQLDRSSPGIF